MTSRSQKIARLRTKISAARMLDIVAAPTLQPREMFLQIGRTRYQVASIRQAVDMYTVARDAAGLGASQMPQVSIVSNTGLTLYRISYNGRVWCGDAMGVKDTELTDF